MITNDLIQGVIQLQKRLSKANIPSAVIGGLAVGIWGEPRLTRDVDLKVLLQRRQATRLLSVLNADYVFLADTPEQTLKRMGMLFVQDNVTGLRFDLLLADTPFDVQAIERTGGVLIVEISVVHAGADIGGNGTDFIEVPVGGKGGGQVLDFRDLAQACTVQLGGHIMLERHGSEQLRSDVVGKHVTDDEAGLGIALDPGLHGAE